MERIYLDNNATTIVDPLVKDAMEPFFCKMYGNPNSLHSFGTEVHPYMRIAMDRLYAGIEASDDDDIIINSCACEGNNTVIQGVYFDMLRGNEKRDTIATSQVEHPSVMKTFEFLESLGVHVVYLPVNADGIITPDVLKENINPERTAFVSIMWANNETGLINPVKDIAAYCREQGILFHTDAVQAVGKIPVSVKDVQPDFLTFSAHKFHGPKGIGGLYVRKGVNIPPLIHGGEQMGGKRAGTLNTPYIIGMGLAMELAVKNLPFEATEVRRLRDLLEDRIAAIPGTQVIGKRELRTPNTILVSFEGIEGEAMIWDLNKQGVAASTGSACSSESLEPNPALVAMGMKEDLAHTGVRFSLSRFTTEEEIDRAALCIQKAVERLTAISTHGR